MQSSDKLLWMELGLGLDFLGQPFFLIVRVDVAVLAHPLGVVHPVSMLAQSGISFATVPVIAVVAHPLGEVLQELMWTVRDHARLPSTLGSLYNLLVMGTLDTVSLGHID